MRASLFGVVGCTVFGMASLSAVEPLASRDAELCLGLRANCVTPAATSVHDRSPRCAIQALPVEQLLRRWETASAKQAAWSDRDREWLRRQAGPELSAHALDLVLKLTQPITVVALEGDFVWQVTSTTATTSVLSATPRDEATQLFCTELHIELDAVGGLPKAVDVVHRTGRQRLVIRPAAVVTARYEVEQTAEDPLPPSPSTSGNGALIRFAAGTLEIDFDNPF
jgi:hypothetical protein